MNRKNFYSMIKYRNDLSFSNLPKSETRELTHSYHHYPAKFIPQLARALIEEYTNVGDCVWDSFCGSGTLNVEAYRTNRNTIGSDINTIATLISRVKTRPLNPRKLSQYIGLLLERIESQNIKNDHFYISKGILNGNLDMLERWFPKDNLRILSHILWHIKNETCEKKFYEFSLCAFSSILKRSSYWLSSSVKPQINPTKEPIDAFISFRRKLREMEKTNVLFYNANNDNKTKVYIFNHNSKHLLPKYYRSIDAIITSPPYLVSYDYSYIFNLSYYFLDYKNFNIDFRRTFIGTPLRRRINKHYNNLRPEKPIIDSINNVVLQRRVNQYYKDMSIFFKKAKSSLRKDGKLIIIIGDTKLRNVKTHNAYLLTRIAKDLGWDIQEIFERDISNKILPTYRDKKTGKFTNKNANDVTERYKKEYILIFNNM